MTQFSLGPRTRKKLLEGNLSEPWALVNISTLRWEGYPGLRTFITIITIIIVIIIIIIIIIIILLLLLLLLLYFMNLK